MIRFGIAQLTATAAYRPEGYLAEVIAAGTLLEAGALLELTPAAYAALRAKYSHSPEKWQLPCADEVARNFVAAAARWVAGGFAVVTRGEYQRRMTLCRACPMWRPGELPGGGSCERCGCGQVKHWLATEVCPVGIWAAP